MRKARLVRKTNETDVKVYFNIDGKGNFSGTTGNAFLDHMLSLFTKHGVFDLEIRVKGDVEVDFHHSNEDVGITLGEAVGKALKTKEKIRRFGTGFAVLDEAQVKVVLDINGRAYFLTQPRNLRKRGENYSFSYLKQFLTAFINSFPLTLHIDIIRGEDFHHILEACFKALGLAMDQATQIDERKKGLPTTKGKL
jgi:imidazoleglycerol-phosphate dehydratase